MYEMLEIIKNVLLLMSLLYFAWQDYHTHYIGVAASVMVGIMGIILQIFIKGSVTVLFELGVSMLVGVVLILVGVVSKESIGIGDGILFMVSGCYLNIFDNLKLFGRTIFLMGGFAFLCLGIKKLRKISRIPMAPFMLVAYTTTCLS